MSYSAIDEKLSCLSGLSALGDKEISTFSNCCKDPVKMQSNIVESKMIGHHNINTGTTMLLKTNLN